MRARPFDWLRFATAFVGSAIAILVSVGLLNFMGDCAPDVTNCGEPERRLSFVLLGLGFAWLIYLVVRFVRDPRKFWASVMVWTPEPTYEKPDISVRATTLY